MSKVCPLRMMALATMTAATMSAMMDAPKHAEKLGALIDKSDKLCNTHNCAMWNKRSKQCGLIK